VSWKQVERGIAPDAFSMERLPRALASRQSPRPR
jgi:hypothetical protein